MIEKYKSLTRTTLDKTDNLPHVGVYVLAYMGKVVYVGVTTYSVADRLHGHWRNRVEELLGDWMDKLRFDWCNIRLDVLEPPDGAEGDYWLRQVEAALVRRFEPLFNFQLQDGFCVH